MSDVFITIDTEFSAGGYFNGHGQPVTDQAVYCRLGGISHGLGFMLDTFAHHGVKATFFVEAAHTALLGYDAMKPAIEDIASAGHDIQLHIHPMWTSKRQPVSDSFENLTMDETVTALETGMRAFAKWGLPKPIAFRAGNLQIGEGTYDALAKIGIPISSFIGLAVHAPTSDRLQLQNGLHRLGDVIEVPVLTYSDFGVGNRRHLKNLTITGSGGLETKAVLETASQVLDDLVILTHPFEFIKRRNGAFDRISRNRVNQKKLIHLCRMLSEHSHLKAQTFAGKAAQWLASDTSPAIPVHAPLPYVVGRIVENQLSDRLRWF